MKNLTKILLYFGLFLAIHIGYANTIGNSESEIPLSKEQQTNQQAGIPEKIEEESTANTEVEINQDSLEDGSVSKYNFIFYFLYKFKYDEHEEVTP